MRPMGLMGLIGLMGLMSLVGCSSDDDELKPLASQGTIVPEVASYVTWFEEANGSSRSNRAWAVPSGYAAYEGGIKPIGIAFTQNTKEPMMGNFFFSSGKWRTSVEDIKAETYYLYGYIPHLPAIRYSITDLVGTNANYSTGAIMTLENVPTVMANDLCVVIGAKDGTDKETVTGLRRGDFAYAAKAISEVDGKKVDGGNYVFLLFDHLYAALRVKMKVHADYALLRTIKLKSLQLSTQADETTSKLHNTITIEPAGQELTTTFQDFTGHFMPSGITTLVLTSVYDVYDTKDNKIRENCSATNTMVLSELLTEQETTQRGKRYTVNLTIRPTYLYVLSEPDLDNPTVSVE